MPLLLSAITCGLFMHHSLGCAAIDSLAAIGIMDPKLGVTMLLTILFFNNIFSSKGIGFHDMLVSSLVGSFRSFLMHLRQGRLPFPFVYAIYLLSNKYLWKLSQLKLLGMLPSLASHSVMIPLVVQTILPMLHENAKPYVFVHIILYLFSFC